MLTVVVRNKQERARNELDEFLFEMHSEFANPQTITNFDLLDFVLVDGDCNASPWSPGLRKLALLTKMCMMTGKCLFASGLGASLLAFVCSTGGEHVRVLNNDGKGSLIDDIHGIPPPPRSHALQRPAAAPSDVVLDTKTGDFFAFIERAACWTPKGNTGLILHCSDHAKDYGATINSARAGTKPHRAERQHQLSHPLCVSKRGETKCCIRLQAANHVLFTSFPHREFIANCKSKWDLDEEIASTAGSNKYRVLLDSSRGPMLIEFGNCIGTHFLLAQEYPETCKLLRNYVLAKYEELKVHAHIDRSYVSAISGSSRLKDRLHQAQTRSIHHPHSTHHRNAASNNSANNSSSSHGISHYAETGGGLANNATVMTSGRTSPKRCRPVSAGPSRFAAKGTHSMRTIKTSRSAYPSVSIRLEQAHNNNNTSTMERKLGDTNEGNSNRHPADRHATKMAFASSQSEKPRSPAPEVDEDHHPSHRRVRVPQKNELERPYCAIHKFNRMKLDEKQQQRPSECYYSVINDAPYVSTIERETLERQKGKLKWMAGPFRTAIGKATTNLVTPEAGIFATGPFVQKNTPYYIIQRRELEEDEDEGKDDRSTTTTQPPRPAAAAKSLTPHTGVRHHPLRPKSATTTTSRR